MEVKIKARLGSQGSLHKKSDVSDSKFLNTNLLSSSNLMNFMRLGLSPTSCSACKAWAAGAVWRKLLTVMTLDRWKAGEDPDFRKFQWGDMMVRRK